MKYKFITLYNKILNFVKRPYLGESALNSEFLVCDIGIAKAITITPTAHNKYDIESSKINLISMKAQQAAKTVYSTVDPCKFFQQLNYLLDLLLYLQQYEKQNLFIAPQPSDYYKSILTHLEKIVDEFINRALENKKSQLLLIDSKKDRYKIYQNFLSSLISAFDKANTFFPRSDPFPHYEGPLYTSANYLRVQTYNDELSEIYDRIFLKDSSRHKQKLSYVEKETIIVKQITTETMLQFSNLPYDLNFPIKKYIKEGGHPFAYIDLNLYNQSIAKKHIFQLEKIIDENRYKIPLLKEKYYIDADKTVFIQYDDSYGYTRLMCTPYNVDGKISKYPLNLTFMTKSDSKKYQFIGYIYYGLGGNIKKADVHIWIEDVPYTGADGWSFYFSSFDDKLILEQAKTTLKLDERNMPSVVYQDKSLIEYEQRKEREKEFDIQNFQWLQKNLPDICPKSLAGFRRMRTANSKNYQLLVKEAQMLGKNIEDSVCP